MTTPAPPAVTRRGRGSPTGSTRRPTGCPTRPPAASIASAPRPRSSSAARRPATPGGGGGGASASDGSRRACLPRRAAGCPAARRLRRCRRRPSSATGRPGVSGRRRGRLGGGERGRGDGTRAAGGRRAGARAAGRCSRACTSPTRRATVAAQRGQRRSCEVGGAHAALVGRSALFLERLEPVLEREHVLLPGPHPPLTRPPGAPRRDGVRAGRPAGTSARPCPRRPAPARPPCCRAAPRSPPTAGP